MNLFLIGNGFDLAHHMNSSYDDFRRYVQKRHGYSTIARASYEDLDIGDLYKAEVGVAPDGGAYYDEDEAASLVYQLICIAEPKGDLWRDLEASLAHLEYAYCFDHLPQMTDREGDTDHFAQMHNNEDRAAELLEVVPYITTLFNEWADTLKTDKVVPRRLFQRLIDPVSDQFVNFNYTPTLQDVYGAKKVAHIHGMQGGHLEFGHGDTERSLYDEYEGTLYGAEGHLQQTHDKLRKDTPAIVARNKGLFSTFKNSTVGNVYSYGFSFGDVDLHYVRELAKRLTRNDMTWYLHKRRRRSNFGKIMENDKIHTQKQLLRKNGWMGKVQTFFA